MTQLTVTLKNKSKAKTIVKTISQIEGVEKVELSENDFTDELSDDEKKLLDQRWEAFEKNGKLNVMTWETAEKKIRNKHGI